MGLLDKALLLKNHTVTACTAGLLKKALRYREVSLSGPLVAADYKKKNLICR